MEFEFSCGTVLSSEELNNYTFLFVPDDYDDYDTGIGSPDQEFWDVDLSQSDDYELFVRATEGRSDYIATNGGVYIPFGELMVYKERVENKPLPLEKQKVLAKATLDKLRLASPKAVVAGGAARCFLQGEQANDIDIFLDLPSYLNQMEMRDMLSKLLPDKRISQVSGAYSATPSAATGLRTAFHFYEDGQEVQLLVVEGRPDEQMNRFPYSHTQVSWDGERFSYHDSFDMFLDFKVVIKNYHPVQASYEEKVTKLFKERGWSVAQSQDEALTMAMDSVKLTA